MSALSAPEPAEPVLRRAHSLLEGARIGPNGELVYSDDRAPRTVCAPVRWANGIGLSPDGATLYVSDYARREVLACPAGGGDPRRFAPSPRGSADGPAVDAEGCGGWRSAMAQALRDCRRRARRWRSSRCRRASSRASASAERMDVTS